MRRIFLIPFILFCFSLSLAAQEREDGVLADLKNIFSAVPVQQQKYWQHKFLLSNSLSSQIQKQKGVWDVVKDWATGQEKQRKIEALSDYLFNMFISTTAQGYTPKVLNLDFAGVLDPLEKLPTGYKVEELLSLYFAEKEKVKKQLAYHFEHILNINYSLHSVANDAKEAAFLTVLKDSYRFGNKVGYQGRHKILSQIQAQLKKEITMVLQDCIKEGTVCTYERMDMMDMLDRKNGAVKKEYYYRPAELECDAGSYLFCKTLSTNTKKQYGGWTLTAVRRIRVKPVQYGSTLAPAEGTAFISARGEKYPAWDYHVASLLSLQKEGEYLLLVEDPFLFEEAVPVSVWANRFHATKNIFFLTPFQRQEQIEKQLIQVDPSQRKKAVENKPIFIKGKQYNPAVIREVK